MPVAMLLAWTDSRELTAWQVFLSRRAMQEKQRAWEQKQRRDAGAEDDDEVIYYR
jgi:hypothetical protein